MPDTSPPAKRRCARPGGAAKPIMGNAHGRVQSCCVETTEEVEFASSRRFDDCLLAGIDSASSTGTTASTASPRSSTSISSSRHLVINMDINKTVIMTDSTTGKSAEAVVNEELSSASWGTEVDGRWRLVVPEPSIHRPQGHGDSLVTYADWVAKALPSSDQKDARRRLKATFTAADQPGAGLSALASQLRKELTMPDGSEVRLIPAFFELLIFLKQSGRSFTVCFRTFGEDLDKVAKELTQFCEGRHPLFPGFVMDGSDGDADYRLTVPDPERCGTFFREKDGKMSLVMGTVEQPGEGQYKSVKDRTLGFFGRFPGVRLYEGLDVVSSFLSTRCASPGSFGLRDHYAHWKANGQVSEAGKVFCFDHERGSPYHNMFFDDNVDFTDFKIVCPIYIKQPDRRFPVLALMQSHVCKAEPLLAIRDRQYFINELQRLEEGYERRLRARERWTKACHSVRAIGRWSKLASCRKLEACKP